MEEKALWQYTRFVYANQVDTFTFDTVLSGIVERIEEQWQISPRTDDLEIRYDENNGLEVFLKSHATNHFGTFEIFWTSTDLSGRPINSATTWDFLSATRMHRFHLHAKSCVICMILIVFYLECQPHTVFRKIGYFCLVQIPDATDHDRAPIPVIPAGMKRIPKHQLTFTVCEWHGGTQTDLQVAELNLETNSFREHQVEFFFYKLVGDWHTAQKMGNYWRQHYGLETLQMDPVPVPDPPASVLPDVSTLDPATMYAAQLMTVCRSLPSAASPEQQRSQLLRLVQDSEVRNLFTPIDLNTLATQIHQLADLLSKANALPMEVHLTPTDAAQL
eukprot:s225_g10.t1